MVRMDGAASSCVQTKNQEGYQFGSILCNEIHVKLEVMRFLL
jgi:hypothetical protein